jgi:hypothetical protein
MFEVTCVRCGTVFYAEDQHHGSMLRCTKCGDLVPIARTIGTTGTTSPASQIAPHNVHRRGWLNLRRNNQQSGSSNHIDKFLAVFLRVFVAGAVLLVLFRFARLFSKSQPKPPSIVHRLDNGDEPGPNLAGDGQGVLVVSNGTNLDAYVILVTGNNNRRVRGLYVKSQHSSTLSQISPGTYHVYFTTGWDWSDQTHSFTSQSHSLDFQKPLVYGTYGDESYAITLNPVPDGNVPVSSISDALFHGLDR